MAVRPPPAANGAGQIWRVEPNGTIEALTRPEVPSAAAVGRGPGGFREGNLYAVTFHGDIEFAYATR